MNRVLINSAQLISVFGAYLGFSFSVAASMAACGVGVSHNKVCVAGFNLPRFGWGLFFGLVSFFFFFRSAVDHSAVTSSDI